MKKIILSILASLATLSLSADQYFCFGLGVNDANLTNQSDRHLKIGVIAGVRYGFIFSNGVRAEVEMSYRINHFKTQHELDFEEIETKTFRSFHSWAYMINALYDVNQLQTYGITPYIGTGIGYCQNTEKNKVKFQDWDCVIENKIKDGCFAYQIIFGAKYPLNDSLSTGVEYKYFCGTEHKKDHSVAMTLAKSF